MTQSQNGLVLSLTTGVEYKNNYSIFPVSLQDLIRGRTVRKRYLLWQIRKGEKRGIKVEIYLKFPFKSVGIILPHIKVILRDNF